MVLMSLYGFHGPIYVLTSPDNVKAGQGQRGQGEARNARVAETDKEKSRGSADKV